jgi:hypothetical protein
MRHEAAGITTENFPPALEIGPNRFALEYHFEPGSPRDGVTMNVPLALLNQVPAARTEWLVPGLRKEKVKALAKSMPQRLRHKLGSVEEFAGDLPEATFVARSVDVDIKHLTMVLERAAHHQGTAFVEVYQDCNVFNSGAFNYAAKKDEKDDNVVYLEHGRPLIFGKNRDKGIRVNEMSRPEVVQLGGDIKEDDLLFHDEKAEEPSLAFLLARMRHPQFPEPVGVFRSVERPIYDQAVHAQVENAVRQRGEGDLEALFNSGDTWTVE